MAGLSTKAIKSKIKSMESTRQITKAMELVAASKLRSAQNKAIGVRPYFAALYETMSEIAGSVPSFESPFLRSRPGGRPLAVVIAGDRGLAGGYNSNILKLALSQLEGTDAVILPIGKRAVEFFRHRGMELLTERYADASEMTIGKCYSVARILSDGFVSGKYDRISLLYTNFVSVLSQTPAALELLPLKMTAEKHHTREIYYESGSGNVFNAIVPEYLGGLLYAALCESQASEQAARRTAMDAATKNAEEMIDDLNLRFNRARQGAITQEITEIVAGAEA